jgi:hypothetical protein
MYFPQLGGAGKMAGLLGLQMHIFPADPFGFGVGCKLIYLGRLDTLAHGSAIADLHTEAALHLKAGKTDIFGDLGYGLYLFTLPGTPEVQPALAKDSSLSTHDLGPGFDLHGSIAVGRPLGGIYAGMRASYAYYFPYSNPPDGGPYFRFGNALSIGVFVGFFEPDPRKKASRRRR